MLWTEKPIRMGHENLVMVGAAVVGFAVVVPVAGLWAVWLVRRRGADRSR